MRFVQGDLVELPGFEENRTARADKFSNGTQPDFLGLIAAEISLAGRCFIQIVARCSMVAGTFGEHFQGALW